MSVIKLNTDIMQNIMFDIMIWINNCDIDIIYKNYNLFNYERIKFLLKDDKTLFDYVSSTQKETLEYIYSHKDLNKDLVICDTYISKKDDNLDFYIGFNLVNKKMNNKEKNNIKIYNSILCNKVYQLNKYNEFILKTNFDLLKCVEISCINEDDIEECILFFRQDLSQNDNIHKLNNYYDIPLIKLEKDIIKKNLYNFPEYFGVFDYLNIGIKILYKRENIPIENRNINLYGLILDEELRKNYGKSQLSFFTKK